MAILDEQNVLREPDLVPIRHGRMLVSPFTFFRGAARIMAADLAATPRARLEVQLCGDAHLSNFGAFASPERALLFDINDFDETLPGPFEYDVKRLAASFAIAARNNGFRTDDVERAAIRSAKAYRNSMATFASMRTLDVWYAKLDVERALADLRSNAKKRAVKRGEKAVHKARTHDSLQALAKLGEKVEGGYRIASQPPTLIPFRDAVWTADFTVDDAVRLVDDQRRAYRATLPDDRRQLLDRFRMVDVARKVVGIGSVGMQAYIVLLAGRDEDDPLFLQLKEATTSVLSDHLPPSGYENQGERVVRGQRMMQAASDIFLGWTSGPEGTRDFYWRQLRDMKSSVDVEELSPKELATYADICGFILARAHARSGDPIALAAYLGTSDRFDHAIGAFATVYADQNERDYRAFVGAVRSGRLKAAEGV